jgi:hypothetical protein
MRSGRVVLGGGSAKDCGDTKAEVLCQPPAMVAPDVGVPSSSSRSALRAAVWVTAAPSIRWRWARPWAWIGQDLLLWFRRATW